MSSDERDKLLCLTWDQIKEIATRVRIWMEVQAILNMDAVSSRDLGGGCAIASYILWKLLLSAGEEAKLICAVKEYEAHCWVELGPYVIDVTFTQFEDCEKVHICRKWPPHYEADRYLSDDDALEEISHWKNQSPIEYSEYIDWFLRDTSRWIQKKLLQSVKEPHLGFVCWSKHMTNCTKGNSGDRI